MHSMCCCTTCCQSWLSLDVSSEWWLSALSRSSARRRSSAMESRGSRGGDGGCADMALSLPIAYHLPSPPSYPAISCCHCSRSMSIRGSRSWCWDSKPCRDGLKTKDNRLVWLKKIRPRLFLFGSHLSQLLPNTGSWTHAQDSGIVGNVSTQLRKFLLDPLRCQLRDKSSSYLTRKIIEKHTQGA